MQTTEIQENLWSKSLGVSREHASTTNVVQVQEELHDTFQTNTASTVWGSTELEAVQVGLDSIDFNAQGLGSALKHVGIVNCKQTIRNCQIRQ